MGGTGKRNEQTRRWVQTENGELIVISQTGENEDEEKQWNKNRWVLLIELFMYFGSAYIFIVTWNNRILQAVRHIHYMWMKNNQVNEGPAHILKKTRFCPLIFTNIYFFLKPRLHVMTWPYKISF